MINRSELQTISKYFKSIIHLDFMQLPVHKLLARKHIRMLSITPDGYDMLVPNSTGKYGSKSSENMAIDSVVKRYFSYEKFIELVLLSIENTELNGVQLEISEKQKLPPMVAKI